MPIKKFRDVADMKRRSYQPASPELEAVTRYIWSLSEKICPLRFPPGVYKHRSIEDAESLRAMWQHANVRAQQARIRAKPARDPEP
jgi:hypothetical protein